MNSIVIIEKQQMEKEKTLSFRPTTQQEIYLDFVELILRKYGYGTITRPTY